MAFSVGVLIEGISEVIEGIIEVIGACDVDGVLVGDGACFSLVLHAVNVLIPMIAAPPARRAI
jgi:hypothetical protein